MALEIVNICCKDVVLINCVATVSVKPLLEALGTADALDGAPDAEAEVAPPAAMNDGNDEEVEGVPDVPEVGVPKVGNVEELVLVSTPDVAADATLLRTTANTPPATAKNG